MVEALEVPVSSDDIEITHNLHTRDNKAIIAKLVTYKAKRNFYRARNKTSQTGGPLPRLLLHNESTIDSDVHQRKL